MALEGLWPSWCWTGFGIALIGFGLQSVFHMENKFEIIQGAYRGRLLARTAEEFRALAGASWETIADNKEKPEEMERYYHVLNRVCKEQTGEELDDMVRSYERMSRVDRGKDSDGNVVFDWKKRKDSRGRKKFFRWIFRTATASVCRVSDEEKKKFKVMATEKIKPADKLKKEDKELKALLFPHGITSENGLRDLIFLLLLTFDIIPSMPEERGSDGTVEDLRKQLKAMIVLLETLRDDFPNVGVLSNPIVFDNTLGKLGEILGNIEEPEECAEFTVTWLWAVLEGVITSCRMASSPQHISDSGLQLSGYRMNGIWVDDADEGRTRFWVFPDNQLMAFCYQQNGEGAWQMTPYEFDFYSKNGIAPTEPTCTFGTAKGNKEMLTKKGKASQSEVVSASYETSGEEEWFPFGEISFECLNHRVAPKWFDWRSFRRLGRDDERHEKFRKVLEDVYEDGSNREFVFENKGAFMTDSENALLAIDREYIYVTAATGGRKWRLRCVNESEEMYEYLPAKGKTLTLLNVEVSAECPLYLIPRFWEEQSWMTEAQKRFIEAARNTDISDQVTIYRVGKDPVLCFNRFGITVPLDEAGLERYGIRKLCEWRGEKD